LADFVLVLISGAVWMVQPEWGLWIILVALLPWVARLVSGGFPFQRSSLDWLIAILLITAWIGYWASYDRTTAWSKVWFIVLGVLVFYALSAQPRQNRAGISTILFAMGVGVSIYYLLTHDFAAAPRKLEFVNALGLGIMGVRPQTGWTPIHPNYVAGIVALTVPFVLYTIWEGLQSRERFSLPYVLLIAAGLAVAGIALLMATSRGVFLAMAGGAGAVFLLKLIYARRAWQGNRFILFLALVIYLCVIVALLYAGPARTAGGVTGSSYYGNGSRAELFSSSLNLVADYPFTGGGLGSFPGLYSHYLLNIPFDYLANSHNLFLDVAIEQGLIAGLAFLILYLAGLWIVLDSIVTERGIPVFQLLVVFSLIAAMVHGMVDNYLYNGVGAVLSLFLVGLSVSTGQEAALSPTPGAKPVRVAQVSGMAVFIVAGVLAFLPSIRSMWHANLGAVQLSKVELHQFPSANWDLDFSLTRLDTPEASLRSALELDPANRTANHRLGLIAMLRGDFLSAAGYLETALEQSPEHRGIIKSLGYCYTWLDNVEKARPLLEEIPEARSELEVYVWWWDTQGRPDLSAHASDMASDLKNNQP
jgi:O-antigen ligase